MTLKILPLVDDDAVINQVVYRRYSKLLKDKKSLPDIIFIDGGLGQFNQAIMVMNSIGVNDVQLVGIAKGDNRKAGLDTLIMVKNDKVNKINLPPETTLRLYWSTIFETNHTVLQLKIIEKNALQGVQLQY